MKKWHRKPYRGPLVKRGKTVVGENYRPNCCQCASLPWDSCLCPPVPSDAEQGLEPMPLGASDRFNAEADWRLQLALEAA